MKTILVISAIILGAIYFLSGCGTTAPDERTTPTTTEETTVRRPLFRTTTVQATESLPYYSSSLPLSTSSVPLYRPLRTAAARLTRMVETNTTRFC